MKTKLRDTIVQSWPRDFDIEFNDPHGDVDDREEEQLEREGETTHTE